MQTGSKMNIPLILQFSGRWLLEDEALNCVQLRIAKLEKDAMRGKVGDQIALMLKLVR